MFFFFSVELCYRETAQRVYPEQFITTFVSIKDFGYIHNPPGIRMVDSLRILVFCSRKDRFFFIVVVCIPAMTGSKAIIVVLYNGLVYSMDIDIRLGLSHDFSTY